MPLSWAIEDAIIAIVNEDPITFKDLQDYLNAALMRLKIENRPPHEIKKVMEDLEISGLQKLIQDRLLLDEAKIKEIEIPDSSIYERIDKFKAQYPSEEKFIESLLSEGYTTSDLMDKIRDQLLIQNVVDKEIRSQITVNPQEVTDYYEKNRHQFKQKERINLDSIFISSSPSRKEAKEKIDEVYSLLEEGRDFREIAEKYSQTPSIGIIAKGQMRTDIEDIIFNLNLQEKSPIIEVENGYYIFKLLGRMPSKIQPLEEVKDTIKEIIGKEKFQNKFSIWINDLKKKAYIEIKK